MPVVWLGLASPEQQHLGRDLTTPGQVSQGVDLGELANPCRGPKPKFVPRGAGSEGGHDIARKPHALEEPDDDGRIFVPAGYCRLGRPPPLWDQDRPADP